MKFPTYETATLWKRRPSTRSHTTISSRVHSVRALSRGRNGRRLRSSIAQRPRFGEVVCSDSVPCVPHDDVVRGVHVLGAQSRGGRRGAHPRDGRRTLPAGQAHRLQGCVAHLLVQRQVPQALPRLATPGAVVQGFRWVLLASGLPRSADDTEIAPADATSLSGYGGRDAISGRVFKLCYL